jgi:hypothetical protein
MFITNDPGPWQYYVNRQDNVGLSLMEVKDKYMREQLLFEQQINFMYQQQMIMSQASSGGGPSLDPSEDPSENNYVVNDYIDDYFE